ncbi:hypothetical protein GGR44_000384 [Sphingobium fontiphilum]|uniref:Putative DNA-binding domain-containing protein n=1 Tax=Sphingobium fontiphilum TaxID=944425 RepID=A0A7W6DCN5_9SPHN|nr:DNA-binding domain-containing protein [Sphingobium fontiphilum]MBB3980753.1 hypothetical protein [Sphingobium fontiphilum]
MTLAAIQNDFRLWLSKADDAAAARIGDGPGLAVYQNNYRVQLMDCLESAYPQSLAWLGDAAFRAVAAHHVDRFAPDSWTIDDYPADFATTLATFYPDDPEVGELAILELALANAFVALDSPVLTTSDLPATDWDRASLRLAPSAKLLTMTTNAAAIWSALAQDEEPPAAALLHAPVTLMTWRHDHISCYRTLDGDEAAIFRSLGDGLGFADICAALADRAGDDAPGGRAGLLLARWATEQCLAFA